MITVYLVDDHPIVREGLKTFLSTIPDIQIVGEADSGEAAVKEIISTKPDVALIDIRLPGITGIEVTKKLHASSYFTKVIILSSFCDDDEVISAFDAGAIGYLMKDSPPQKIAEAIYNANKGKRILNPRIEGKLSNRNKKSEEIIEKLSAKEMEVLCQLSKGKSNKEIARELYLSETTIKTHVSSILQKIGAKDRTHAVVKAFELKLVERA